MKKLGICAILMVLLCVCLLSAAVAEEQPAAESEPAATNEVAETASSIQLNEPTFSNGKFTITWTDEAEKGPYTVYLDINGDSSEALWYKVATVSKTKKSYSAYLVPGRYYGIAVASQDGQEVEYSGFTVPEITKKVDGAKFSVSQKYLYYMLNGEYKEVKTLKASAMKKHWGTDGYYYVYFLMMLKKGSVQSSHLWYTVTAPDGFALVEEYEDTTSTISLNENNNGEWLYTGMQTFNVMLQCQDEIPTGKYTVRVYLDDALAFTKTFKVE